MVNYCWKLEDSQSATREEQRTCLNNAIANDATKLNPKGSSMTDVNKSERMLHNTGN